ncbi:MAG: hypothetical protein WCG15_08635 [Actinomycetes bacterium]|jgi:hypothetical protein
MLTDSKQKMLSQMEILTTAFQTTKTPYTTEEAIAAVIAESRLPNSIMIRQGNTIFCVTYDPKQKNLAYFRALNADTPANYLQNSLEFIKAVGLAGFSVLVTQFYDSSLLNIFKYIAKKPPFPGMGYAVQETEDGGYRVTINLGTPKSAHGGTLPSAPKKAKGAL